MEHRTTFALDSQTVKRLKKLASSWSVSQAEVVRRAVENAEQAYDTSEESPLIRLQKYHETGGLAAEKAAEYLKEVEKNRTDWGREG
ncbi:hypothetical protein MASR2M78_30090 [Treponema sp.]